MIDQKKRKTLKSVGLTIPAVMLPNWVLSASESLLVTDASATNNVSYNDQHFSIELSFGSEYPAKTLDTTIASMKMTDDAWITITNHSNKVAVVKHVYPGLIHAGKVAYDINAIFSDSACGIDAGRSRSFRVQPVSTTQAEADFPRHLFRNKPLRIAQTTGHNNKGLIVQSTRTVYC